jgi:tetratricopeptide (TPR) repeat protein
VNGMSTSSAERLARVWRRRPVSLIAVVAAATLFGVLARKAFSPDPEALLKEANACAARDPARAVRLLQTAIRKARGKFPEAEIALCRLSARRGEWETALPVFAALDHKTCPASFLLEFGESALAAHRPAEAVEALTEVRRRRIAASVTALDVLFAHYRQRNEEREMINCVHEMAELCRNRPELWWKLLELLDARQLDSEYMSVLREALWQQLPARDMGEMQHRLVARLVDLGDVEQARRELAAIIAHEGLSERARLHQAAIDRLEGNSAAALEMIEAALAKAGEQPGAVRLRALIHLDLGMYNEAAEDFRKGIEEDPYDLVAHFKLAETYRKLGKLDLAQKHEAISLEIRDKRQRINKLREATGRRPSDRRLFEELAELHRDLNDARSAALWQERASRLSEPAAKP